MIKVFRNVWTNLSSHYLNSRLNGNFSSQELFGNILINFLQKKILPWIDSFSHSVFAPEIMISIDIKITNFKYQNNAKRI